MNFINIYQNCTLLQQNIVSSRGDLVFLIWLCHWLPACLLPFWHRVNELSVQQMQFLQAPCPAGDSVANTVLSQWYKRECDIVSV